MAARAGPGQPASHSTRSGPVVSGASPLAAEVEAMDARRCAQDSELQCRELRTQLKEAKDSYAAERVRAEVAG